MSWLNAYPAVEVRLQNLHQFIFNTIRYEEFKITFFLDVDTCSGNRIVFVYSQTEPFKYAEANATLHVRL